MRDVNVGERERERERERELEWEWKTLREKRECGEREKKMRKGDGKIWTD